MRIVFRVTQRRKEGALIPRWRDAFRDAPEALISITEQFDHELRRITLVAALHDPVTHEQPEGFPPLYDARVIYATSDWTITGIERDFDKAGTRDYAQSWLMTPVRLIDDEPKN